MTTLFGNNLNEYYVNLVRRNHEERARRIAAMTSMDEAKRYVGGIREKIRSIHKFPERTPLNSRLVSRRELKGYVLECIIFYSRPGYPVTANLYLPLHTEKKCPGVLLLCGHSPLGKAAPAYRSAATGLVLKGFAVLVIDPVEQGERKQYSEFAKYKDRLCGNHNMMGKQMALIGDWFGTWRTWDAIRALDYMETRAEIDGTKLSVTGNSGGGTMTALLAAVDARPVAVAPSCYITSWKHNVENELPADIEQMPPGALAMNLEMGDLLLAQAPRRILILGQSNDFFDPRGVEETFKEVERVNSLLGGETKCFIGPRGHGFHIENREAVYRFLTNEEDAKEPEFILPAEEDTFAAAGSVRTLPDNRMLRDIVREQAGAYIAGRKKHSLTQLRDLLKKILGLDDTFVPYYRVLRGRAVGNGIVASRFGLETEGVGIMSVLARYSVDGWYHLDSDPREITLYIPNLDSFDELKGRKIPECPALYALDTRGIGEMTPSGTDQPEVRNFFAPYQFDYHYAALSVMFDKTILGGRVHDLLCALELLGGAGGVQIDLEAKGLGCILALMGAVLSDRVRHLRLTDAPDSFESIVKEEITDFPYSYLAPGIVLETDLPELKEAIAEKILRTEEIYHA